MRIEVSDGGLIAAQWVSGMKRSKLEMYYRDQFGADTADRDEGPPAPRPARPVQSDPPRRERRGGIGFFGLVKLTLMLGPMAFLLGTTLLTDCGGFAQGSWLPEILRSGACARRDLAGRVLSLEGQLRTVASGFR